MTGLSRYGVFLLVGLLLGPPSVFGRPPPPLVNYQGRLVEGTNLVSGTLDIRFLLYTVPAGGVPRFAETQTVQVVDGLFTAHIGAAGPDAGAWSDALTNEAVYLEVQIEGTPLTPRERLVSVPYAHVAARLVYTNGMTAEDRFLDASGDILSGDLVITGSGNGIVFPDMTKQTTAASAGGSLPLGSSILATNAAPPSGYRYSGDSLASGGWTSLSPALFPFSDADSAVLGSNIYIIGGFDGTGPIASNQIYSPASETWASARPLPTPRSDLAVAPLDGVLYAVGGRTAAGYSSTNEIYDPSTDSWAAGAPLLPARANFACVALAGSLYAIGGEIGSNTVTDLVQRYDPAADTWTAVSNLSSGRAYMDAVVLDGLIYVAGGYNGAHTVAIHERYDPAADTWTPRAPLRRPRSDLRTALAGNAIYAVGGHDDLRWLGRNERYDPAADIWFQEAPMFTERGMAAMESVDSRIYVIGGRDNVKDRDIFDVIERYKPPRTYYIHTRE